MVNNLWCLGMMVGVQAHANAFKSLTGNPSLFWSPLSSWWGSEVGINCTSERLTHTPPPSPLRCLLRSQAAVFVLTLKFIPQSESLLLRVFPSIMHWHIRTPLWAVYTVAVLWVFFWHPFCVVTCTLDSHTYSCKYFSSFFKVPR